MENKNRFQILSPIDGDMLNERDGIEKDDCLMTKIEIFAPPGCSIIVNGISASYSNGLYIADVCLKGYSNVIEVLEKNSGYRECITVYWLRSYTGRYRLSLDDNIWFLRDIACHADEYNSIFDNQYLDFFKKVNKEYGTKIHINIYYQDGEFNLSQMPAKYKSEWKENSSWLKLSFHALQDKPDRPYMYEGYEKMRNDCEMVMNQVRRFAGQEVMGSVTTLHWGEATVEGCRALRDVGYKCQVGDFNVDNNLPAVSYYLDVEKRRHINNRFIWKDNKEGIIFFRSSIIIDCHRIENIAPFLDKIWEEPQKSGFIDLLIHEQYFYPQYFNYQSDYRDKVISAVKWAMEKGYRPSFLSECIFE